MPQPFRLLMVSPYIPHLGRHAGGARVFYMLEQFAKLGCEINLIAMINDPVEREHIDALKPHVNRLHVFEGGSRRAGRDPLHLWPVDYRFPEVVNCLRDELRKNDAVQYDFVEMIHLHPKDSPIPSCIVNHEVQHETWLEYTAQSKRFSKEMALNVYRTARALGVEYLSLKRASCNITVTERDREKLQRLNPEARVEVVEHGIDAKDFANVEEKRKPFNLLYLGYYRHKPNEEAAIMLAREIFPRIKQKFPEATLELAGTETTEVVKALSGNGVIASGRVEDLPKAYASCSIFIAPIHHGWGIRSKIMEAMAAGTAVVTTKRGATGIGAQDRQDIFLAESPQEFADAIIELWQNEELHQNISAKGRELVLNKFDWSNMAKKNLQILKSLM